jgi:hypothetical protein
VAKYARNALNWRTTALGDSLPRRRRMLAGGVHKKNRPALPGGLFEPSGGRQSVIVMK